MKKSRMTLSLCVLAFASAAPAFAAPCESLAALALKGAAITAAQLVPAGRFSAPGAPPGSARSPG